MDAVILQNTEFVLKIDWIMQLYNNSYCFLAIGKKKYSRSTINKLLCLQNTNPSIAIFTMN